MIDNTVNNDAALLNRAPGYRLEHSASGIYNVFSPNNVRIGGVYMEGAKFGGYSSIYSNGPVHADTALEAAVLLAEEHIGETKPKPVGRELSAGYAVLEDGEPVALTYSRADANRLKKSLEKDYSGNDTFEVVPLTERTIFKFETIEESK